MRAKYRELADWVRGKIESGVLGPGEKLYSENELSAMFELSRQTVRHAISMLENEGVLERIQGSGTYVRDSRRTNPEKCRRISLITTYVDGYIFPRLIRSMESVLFEHGYTIQIAFTNNQTERERTILEDILKKDEVAGILIEATKSGIPNPNIPLYKEIRDRGIPVLFFNSYYPQLKLPHVTLDDRAAAKSAAEYLVGAGHRQIGGVFKLDDGQGHLRYEGYTAALREAGLPVCDSRIVWIDTEDVRNMELSRAKILKRLGDCSAVLCYNDEVAAELLNIFQRENIRVPQDKSIVGIDDSELAAMAQVPITSMRLPVEELGEKAAGNLIALIRDRGFDASWEFPAQLVKRESVKERKKI